MRWYLDASVAAHAVLPFGDDRASNWMDAAVADGGVVVSSALLELEVIRALRRERCALARSAPLLRRVAQITLDDAVLRIAADIEPHVKALDAIHLATCAMLGDRTTLVSHDTKMLAAADAIGMPTHDPLA